MVAGAVQVILNNKYNSGEIFFSREELIALNVF